MAYSEYELFNVITSGGPQPPDEPQPAREPAALVVGLTVCVIFASLAAAAFHGRRHHRLEPDRTHLDAVGTSQAQATVEPKLNPRETVETFFRATFPAAGRP